MAAPQSVSEILNILTGGGAATPELVDFTFTQGTVTTTSTRSHSLWLNKGNNIGGASAPGAVAAPTKDTVGALKISNASGGRTKYLIGAVAQWLTSSQNFTPCYGKLMLYDRLLHIGGLNGDSAAAQTVGGTITRYTTEEESRANEIWVEIYSSLGSYGTGNTVSANYLDKDGNSATTLSVQIGGTGHNASTRAIRLPLASGNLGVTEVTNVTLASGTGVSGDFGVTVTKPLIELPISAKFSCQRDFLYGFPQAIPIKNNACLQFILNAPGGSALFGAEGRLVFVET